MKRYSVKTDVTTTEDCMRPQIHYRAISTMEEFVEGEWVRWADVEKLREFLEAQIPDKRIAKLEKALGLVHEGKCPECEHRVRDFKPVFGSFAPEIWATMREEGIDPANGHRQGCSLSKP